MNSRILIAAISLLAFAGVATTADGPNDAQIASIVVTANQGDIDAGNLAASAVMPWPPAAS